MTQSRPDSGLGFQGKVMIFFPSCSRFARTRYEEPPPQNCVRFPNPYTPKLYTGIFPKPYTLHATPYTLHSTPYTLHSTPYTLHSKPCTLKSAPSTIHPKPPGRGGLDEEARARQVPSTLNLQPSSLELRTPNPKPSILNPEPSTLNQKPETFNLQP